jgi:hypothetical protein
MVHMEMEYYTHIYPLSTWERLILPPTMGRSLIDIHMDTSMHPYTPSSTFWRIPLLVPMAER